MAIHHDSHREGARDSHREGARDSHREGARDSHREKAASHARVDVHLRVPRDAAGALPAGVRGVLANVAGVEAVERVEVVGVRPTAFDLRVDATAALSLDVCSTDAARACLEGGFGIERVEVLALDDR